MTDSDPHRSAQAALVVGAVLAFLGASLGYGLGIRLGFALLPVALGLFAVGIVGRTRAVPGAGAVFRIGSRVVALLTVALAGLAVAEALLPDLDLVPARTVAFVLSMASIAVFGFTGLVAGHLRVLPALAVTFGATLLLGGPVALERVADVGFWLSVAGWVALGLVPWGRGDRPQDNPWPRRVGAAAGALAVLVAVAVPVVMALGARRMSRRVDLPAVPIEVPRDSATVAEGERLAQIYGCRGCHAEGLRGQVFVQDPAFGRIVAPNLTRVRERYSDADFERLLRGGVRPDGSPISLAMPASSFAHLADSDVAAILAYVRSVPAVEDSLPRTRWGLLARALMANGTVPFPVDVIDHDVRPPVEPDRGDPLVFGRYLAMSICSECHGLDLRGQTELMVTPNLAVAAAYSPDAFRTLLRTGVPLDGRDLGTMAEVARGRFAHYSDAEIEALYTYLSSLAGGS